MLSYAAAVERKLIWIKFSSIFVWTNYQSCVRRHANRREDPAWSCYFAVDGLGGTVPIELTCRR